jgi:hypothetical protein
MWIAVGRDRRSTASPGYETFAGTPVWTLPRIVDRTPAGQFGVGSRSCSAAFFGQHGNKPQLQRPCRSLPSYVSTAREATAGRSGGDKQARPSNIRRRRFGRTSPTTKCRGRLNRNPASVPRSAAPPAANRGRVHPSQAAARAGACHRTDRHVARAATTERKGTRVFIS